jgi:hypothetical protein
MSHQSEPQLSSGSVHPQEKQTSVDAPDKQETSPPKDEPLTLGEELRRYSTAALVDELSADATFCATHRLGEPLEVTEGVVEQLSVFRGTKLWEETSAVSDFVKLPPGFGAPETTNGYSLKFAITSGLPELATEVDGQKVEYTINIPDFKEHLKGKGYVVGIMTSGQDCDHCVPDGKAYSYAIDWSFGQDFDAKISVATSGVEETLDQAVTECKGSLSVVEHRCVPVDQAFKHYKYQRSSE